MSRREHGPHKRLCIHTHTHIHIHTYTTHIHTHTQYIFKLVIGQDVFNRLLKITMGTNKLDCSLTGVTKQMSKQATDGVARFTKYVSQRSESILSKEFYTEQEKALSTNFSKNKVLRLTLPRCPVNMVGRVSIIGLWGNPLTSTIR